MQNESPFVHHHAICETNEVGARTRIWAFAHILPGARLGSDCNICDHVFIENDVIVGDRVTVKSGVQLWDGITLEDDVFIGPNATFTNDPFPRSRVHLPVFPRTIVRRGASVGANATVLPGMTIGEGAMVGAGAVVTRPVPPHAIVFGNPARIRGYADSGPRLDPSTDTRIEAPTLGAEVGVFGVALIRMPKHEDIRGSLVVAEVGEVLPFKPRRFFVVYAVPSVETRGEHAHRECSQLLVCVSGSCTVLVDDGETRAEVVLRSPEYALYIPAGVWSAQYGYSTDATLVVLASHSYDAADYIRDYGQFLAEMSGRTSDGT